MRILGIDYGSKRVGIAISDEKAEFAIPKKVLKNTDGLINEIIGLIKEGEVSEIVIGESKNYKGEANIIMAEATAFSKELAEKTGLPVHAEPEFMTSIQAARFQGETELLDASAAAIILQSYLDSSRNKKQ